jgi:hypothetical protein
VKPPAVVALVAVEALPARLPEKVPVVVPAKLSPLASCWEPMLPAATVCAVPATIA